MISRKQEAIRKGKKNLPLPTPPLFIPSSIAILVFKDSSFIRFPISAILFLKLSYFNHLLLTTLPTHIPGVRHPCHCLSRMKKYIREESLREKLFERGDKLGKWKRSE